MKKSIVIAGAAALMLVGVSCGKKGCIDANADNYNAAAKRDDGSCLYTGNILFWYDQDTYLNYIIPAGWDSLEYFIEDSSYGTWDVDNAWTDATAPTCSSLGVFVAHVDMGEQANKLHNWSVKDAASGAVAFSGSEVFTGGGCYSIQLLE
jgi:hypothetical protein